MIGVYIVGILTAGTVAISIILELSRQIVDYKLRKKQIEADARIRIEEINAQNKLEIEKLILEDSESNKVTTDTKDRLSDDQRTVREKVRS